MNDSLKANYKSQFSFNNCAIEMKKAVYHIFLKMELYIYVKIEIFFQIQKL
jgi:hypothetical protein